VDAEGRVVGITRRYRDGSKKAAAGGHHGLHVPAGWADRDGPVYLPEGPTDVLAQTAMGLAAVGRPSNMAGVEHLAKLLKDVPAGREIVVLGENDPLPDGRWPGKDGAVKTAEALAAKLGRAVTWGLPPGRAKDVRAWVNARHLEPACGDSWSVAGEAFRSALKPNRLPDAAAPGVLREIDAADLAAAPPIELECLPLLGRAGYVVRGWSHIFAAPPKAGKTELLYASVWDWVRSGERIAYLTEEPETVWRLRLKGDSPPRGLRLIWALGASTEDLMRRVTAGDETVVILDTLHNLGMLGQDECDNSQLARAVMPWVAACRPARR
jgi:hypothetical protein